MDLANLKLEKDGVFYFSEEPKDIKPSHDFDSGDQSKWSYWRKENYAFFKAELEKLPKNKIIADFGAGQSDFRILTSQFNLCAVDFYPYPGINVVCDLTKQLPFLDSSVDVLMMSNLLEHISEPNLFFGECRRVLKPGGALLGTVPFMIAIHQRPYDFYRYTDINLEYLLKKHNFKDVSVKPVLATYIFLFNALTSFFVSAIRRRNLFLRALWLITRMSFKIFESVLKKYPSDPITPLGYLFKTYKGEGDKSFSNK